MNMSMGSGPLRDLPRIRDVVRKRASSWDRTGGNRDFVLIAPGDTHTAAEIEGAGCITHIWMTLACPERSFLRKVVLRIFWDGEAEPSVEVPIGDFFGIGHALTKNFASLPLAMSPEDGRGFNCFFPMPFADGARVEVTSDCEREPVTLYYYVDYEAYKTLTEDLGRFHTQWRRQNPCDGISQGDMSMEEFQLGGENRTGEGNYVILEAEGQGHYVGCHLDIRTLQDTNGSEWYGEGDDMIFIDGEEWPPSLHGTGTEDYFNTAWGPRQEFCSPYHGIILGGGERWTEPITLYRYHIEDPIHFSKSIRVTIEHGHANRRSDDYSSTAYWYQLEPHGPFPPLLSVKDRLP